MALILSKSASSSPAPAPAPDSENPAVEEIKAAAKDVNDAAEALASIVRKLERHYRELDIDVAAWVTVKSWTQDTAYWHRELGWEFVAGNWRLAIRETSGNDQFPEEETKRVWAFNSSPRKSRIAAIEKLAELNKELVKEVHKTARRLREKTAEAAIVAASLLPTPKAGKK